MSGAHSDQPHDSNAAILVKRGLGEVLVTDEIVPELLTPPLLDLRAEPCSHSWQPALAHASADRVLERFSEMARADAPGRVFTYYTRGQKGSEAIAIAAVRDKLTKSFPLEGVPVLGRAFVRPMYRRTGIYAASLEHRLRYVRTVWGSELKAVHLGTATMGVERCFRRMHDGPVTYLGDEDLGKAGVVRALLGLTRDFLLFLRPTCRTRGAMLRQRSSNSFARVPAPLGHAMFCSLSLALRRSTRATASCSRS